jgi:hypothetical protein
MHFSLFSGGVLQAFGTALTASPNSQVREECAKYFLAILSSSRFVFIFHFALQGKIS